MKQRVVRGSIIFFVAIAAVAVALALAPLGGYGSSLLVRMLLFVGLAVSWNILGGIAGQLHLGHAAFFGVGAYVSGWVIGNFDLGALTPWVGMLAAAATGVVLVPILVPAFRARGAYFAILTLAFTFVLAQLAQNYAPGGNSGMFFDSFAIGSAPRIVAAVLIVGLTLWVSWLLSVSRIGRGVVAVRMDLAAAQSLGVNHIRVLTVAMVLSGGLGALIGGFYAANLGYLDPETAFDLNWSVFPLLAAMLGGRGTLIGPVVGAVVWTGLDELVGRVGLDAGVAFILQGGLLWAIALAAPAGMWGIFLSWQRSRSVQARVNTYKTTGRSNRSDGQHSGKTK